MKILDVQVTNINCKLKKPLKIAKMIRERSNSTIVKIITDQGINGYGEATFAHFFAGETQFSASYVIQHFLAPVIKGKDPIDLLPLIDLMNKSIAGNPFAKAAVEMALWDLKGNSFKFLFIFCWVEQEERKFLYVNQSVMQSQRRWLMRQFRM